MRHPRGVVLATVTTVALACAGTPALAIPGVPGGAAAPPAAQAGGSQFGVSVPANAAPVVSVLSVPRSASPGRPPRVTFRIEEPGTGAVYVQVAIDNLATRRQAVLATLGWAHTGRTLSVSWPAGALLVAGTYHVSISAHDHHGRSLLRRAHTSGVAELVVAAPPAPAVPANPVAPRTPAGEAGVLSPAQTVADGAVFPVDGPHNFGGPENRYGAPRAGHIHEGQDVLTAEGTPDVAPLAGTITSTSYQAGGAGYYLVEHTGFGFDFMFAHCEASSFAVSGGETVTAGQQLCRAGQTGDATAPHLHFEMWVGGWQAPGGHSIDPLPYLEAWEEAHN